MTSEGEQIRHFTATGFVVHNGCVALHWHAKVKAWLPAGGHIEPNEDPVQAVIREVLEETGLEVEVVPTGMTSELAYPVQVQPPYTIMVEDIHDPVDGFHKHIDMIYFVRPLSGAPTLADGWRWVTRQSLVDQRLLSAPGTLPAPPPEDVRLLGVRAIDFVETGT